MSRYVSSTAHLTRVTISEADSQALRTVLSDSPARLCASSALAALSAELVAPAALGSGAPALQEAARLLGDDRMLRLAAAAGPQLRGGLDAVRARLAAGPSALPRPQAAALFADLVPLMAHEERTVVAECAADTLDGAGYTVICESGPDADGIEARRGDEVMLLAVTDGGEISIDHVGTDGECGDRQARFEAGMAERGVVLAQRALTAHDDDSGPLVHAAAARRETSLARAVARHVAARPSAPARRPGRGRTAGVVAPVRTVDGGSA